MTKKIILKNPSGGQFSRMPEKVGRFMNVFTQECVFNLETNNASSVLQSSCSLAASLWMNKSR